MYQQQCLSVPVCLPNALKIGPVFVLVEMLIVNQKWTAPMLCLLTLLEDHVRGARKLPHSKALEGLESQPHPR